MEAEGALQALGGDERHYLGRALRARPGERFRLAAPDGAAALAVLEGFEGSTALLRIESRDPDPEERPRLTLDLCPPRGDALDLAADMAAQLGVAGVRLVLSERTLAGPGQLHPERLARRLREACRQCLRARVPLLEEPLPLAQALALPFAGARLILSERGGEPLPRVGESARVLVGPEGGFSAAELGMAREAGWVFVSLGPRPLRTPTAVAAALGGLRALAALA